MQTTISLPDVYQRPDLQQLRAEVETLARETSAAHDGESLLSTVKRWNGLRNTLSTARNIAQTRYHQNTRDEAAKAEEDFFNEAAPVLRELDVLYAKTLLASPHRDALDKTFGPQLLALKGCEAKTFAPEIASHVAEEAKLVSRYTELTARPEVSFRGEQLSMSGIAKYFVSPDRATRREAHQARDQFLSKYGEELDDIYDQLVRLRDQMGRALGYENFTPLGYQLMNRTDYGAAEVKTFREEIVREIVPLSKILAKSQAKRLGLDRLMYYDEAVPDLRGSPVPQGGVEFCVEAARTMYRELGPEFDEFFTLMTQRGLLDLEMRPGKAGGGFCTSFPTLGVPFIFANFNGTDGDVQVLTHECGHAFQAYQSRKLPAMEYAFPTSEAAEIHSMSMEFLTYPWMHLFFGQDEAERFRAMHLERALTTMPYLAAVDHFQHEVYAQPSLTPKERRSLWREMERIYQPEREYGEELPYLAAGGLWQRQLHIYVAPFYYIDYALAMTCALQFWQKSQQDAPQALRDYLAICRLGGSLPFSKIVEVGKVRSPFSAGCLHDVVATAKTVLLA